jgi:hypothetical protein
MRRLLKIFVVATILVGLTPAATEARVRRVPTRIDEPITGLARGDGVALAFEGSISSRKDKCLPGRTLRVTYDDNTGREVVFGESSTDEAGRWKVTGEGPSGVDYVFTVDKARRGSVVCGPDTLSSDELSG